MRRGGGPPGRFSPASNTAVDADDNGHFSLPLPSPGGWTLTASARGYASSSYEEHRQYSSAIVLTADAPTYDLVFRLSPEASVTGIVLDEAGEPVRNAQVALHVVSAPSPDGSGSQMGGVRGSTQTDDRGIYEFANLRPEESLRIAVQTRPWYAASSQPGRGNVNGTGGDATPALDPSLDVTYPLLWFPGVDDATQAETITVHAGEAYQADFRLTPIPSIHLRIITPVNVDASGRAVPSFPVFQRVLPGGGGGFGGLMPIVASAPQAGQTEVSGLSPGTYQVRLQGPNGAPRTAMVEVTTGSVRTLDMTAISSSTANVTVLLDGISDEGPAENSIHIVLTDPETGQAYFPANGPANGFGGEGSAGPRRRPGGPSADRAAPRKGRLIEVPPGRYEVTLYSGRSNAYLTSISAQSADVHGRYVTVRAGDSTLILHLATGLATLSGNVSMHDKPSVGAMVLLVPASLGDAGSFATIGQEQSNTDGSFEISGITPGQYILIAIDHGWQINWSDPSTLRRYLTQGSPIDLTSSEKRKQKIEAQAP
ncbi:MAG TPA: carboxypeptidase-like regulatory domain-containing protein [Edaphobacter sp.]